MSNTKNAAELTTTQLNGMVALAFGEDDAPDLDWEDKGNAFSRLTDGTFRK